MTGVKYQGATGYNSSGPEKWTGPNGALNWVVGASWGPNLRRRRLTGTHIMPPTPNNSWNSCRATGPRKFIGREHFMDLPRNGGSTTILRNLTNFS